MDILRYISKKMKETINKFQKNHCLTVAFSFDIIQFLDKELAMKNCFSNEELRDIILGRVTYRKCPACDANGQQYWDGESGMGVGPFPPAGINPDDIASGDCQDGCNGLGYIVNQQYD